jgi:hypothetical protein
MPRENITQSKEDIADFWKRRPLRRRIQRLVKQTQAVLTSWAGDQNTSWMEFRTMCRLVATQSSQQLRLRARDSGVRMPWLFRSPGEVKMTLRSRLEYDHFRKVTSRPPRLLRRISQSKSKSKTLVSPSQTLLRTRKRTKELCLRESLNACLTKNWIEAGHITCLLL